MKRAILLFALIATPALAEPLAAPDLLRDCTVPGPAPACTAYLRGALAMYEAVGAEQRELAWFCPRPDIEPTQLRRFFVEWANENRAAVAGPAILAVKAAMQDAFPCSE